jgi:thiol-disulfide isomerase/thioredoxin
MKCSLTVRRGGGSIRLLLGMILVAAASGAASVPGAAQDVGLGLGVIPEAVQLEDLDGNAVNLTDYVGRKPVLIQFWATWCPLCSALEPKFRAARQQHGDALDVLIVAVGVNQTTRSIKRHLESHSLPGRVLFDGRGRATRAFRAPTTSYVVALDASGRVVYTGVGADQDIAVAAARAVGSR